MRWKPATAFILIFLLGELAAASAAQGRPRRVVGDGASFSNTALVDTVSGRVTNAKTGRVLPGVSVRVMGTQRGTATGAGGRYTVAVPAEADSLVFSFVGYETAQVAIGGRSEIDVALRPETYVAEELVVVGYGAQERQDLTGAVSSVDPEELERGPTATVGELLKNKVPGLRAVSSGGQPGQELQISIRGAGSISAGTSPLTVVDGQPSNVPVNPADIESIEVLKGPSATAIYGARGANGVILITTKDGVEGDLRVNYTGEVAMQTPSNRLDLLSPQEYQTVMNELVEAGAAGPENRVEELVDGGTDWQDVIFRTAPLQNHDFSFSGGSGSTKYYASLGAFLQEGVVESSSFERYSSRVNLTHEATDELNMGVRLNGLYRYDGYVPNNFSVNRGGGVLYSAFSFDPSVSVRDENGELYRPSYISVNNPMSLILGEDRNAETYRFYGTAYAEYFFISSLSAQVRLGADLFSRREDHYNSRLTFAGESSGGSGNVTQAQNRDLLVEGTITYDDSFGNHDLNVLGGVTAQTFVNRNLYAHAEGFPSDETGTNNFALGNPEFYSANTFKSSNQLLSFIGRANYGWSDRYRLTATLRVDGSSRFGENERIGYFPSAALAWNVDQEPFMEGVDFISRLKARASVGQTGNQAIGNYAALSTFGPGPSVVWDYQQRNTLNPSRLANPDLKWETTQQINLGMDFGLWDARLSGSLDYFWKETSDLIISLPVASSSGFNTRLTNIGSVKNTGLELSLSSQNVSTGDFAWGSDLNLATLHNEVTSIGPLDEIITGGAGFTNQISVIRPGLPLRTYYGYEVEGVWQEGENYEEYNAAPGELRFQDTDDDGAITPDDRVPLGDSFPDLTWGLGNTFSYKNFGLYVFVEGSQGVSMLNNQLVLTYLPTSLRRNRIAEPLLNRWTPENPSTEYPSFVNPRNEVAVSSRTVQDASYARLQTVRLSYEVPFESALYRSLTVYALGQNLYTLTDYVGLDPAVNANNNANFRIDYNTYPSTRSYTLGLRLGL